MKFKPGQKVLIVGSKYKSADIVGHIGTITHYYSPRTKYGVIVDDVQNHYSISGSWWLSESELESYSEEIIKEEIFMLPGYKIAAVHFPDDARDDRSYLYALYDDGTYTVGDDVVVKTGHHGMAVAKIVEIQEYQPDIIKCDRQIVCRLDFTAYASRQAKIAEIADLEKKMKEKAKQLQDVALYQILAEKSPEMKCMLDRYTELMK